MRKTRKILAALLAMVMAMSIFCLTRLADLQLPIIMSLGTVLNPTASPDKPAVLNDTCRGAFLCHFQIIACNLCADDRTMLWKA